MGCQILSEHAPCPTLHTLLCKRRSHWFCAVTFWTNCRDIDLVSRLRSGILKIPHWGISLCWHSLNWCGGIYWVSVTSPLSMYLFEIISLVMVMLKPFLEGSKMHTSNIMLIGHVIRDVLSCIFIFRCQITEFTKSCSSTILGFPAHKCTLADTFISLINLYYMVDLRAWAASKV